jgi:hypothetical protein
MRYLLMALLIGRLVSPALAASLAEEGFKKLNGNQIRHTFVGKIFSDEIHFSDRYASDGLIQSESMGTKKTYSWRIEDDRLCITDATSDTCYFIWKKANAVKMVPDGAGVPGDGFIR